jgi:aspartate aminotransferase-like enzyme
MMKYYLMAPGPSMIPERIQLEMALPIVHHRTKDFEELLENVKKQLKLVFQTTHDVIPLACSGTGGMEAMVSNCFSPGDKVLVIRGGKFGERWSEQCKNFGLTVINYDVEWGDVADVRMIQGLYEKNLDIKGVLCQACETSTGAYHPIERIGAFVKQLPNTIFLVDAITALGIMDIKSDAWHIDGIVTGSQKGFMLPPGLSMLRLSNKAWGFVEKAKLPRFYFDLRAELNALKKNQTHFTPAISLLRGLNVALGMMLDEGLVKVFARHKRLAEATREAMRAMELKLLAKEPSDSITAVLAPKGIDGDAVVKRLLDRYNISIVGGQDKLKGRIFRLGHMGYCGDFDVITMISATEMALRDLGYKLDVGTGVAAASRVLYRALSDPKLN